MEKKKKVQNSSFVKHTVYRKKTLVNTIITFIIKNGNKELAKKIFKSALIKASKKLNLGSHFLLINIFKRLHSSVEVKDVKRRRQFFKVPFFINFNRQRYLAVKWLFNSLKMNKAPLPFSDKICLELVQVIKTSRAKSIFLKRKNLKLAINNRSNIHYRW